MLASGSHRCAFIRTIRRAAPNQCKRIWTAARPRTRSSTVCSTRTAAGIGYARAGFACVTRRVNRCDSPDRSATSMPTAAQKMRCASREERYVIATTGSKEGHWVWNLATDELFVSPMMREIFELQPDTHFTTRTEFGALINIHPDDVPALQKSVDDHIAGVTSQFEIEYRLILRDGAIRWIHSRGQCFRDARRQSRADGRCNQRRFRAQARRRCAASEREAIRTGGRGIERRHRRLGRRQRPYVFVAARNEHYGYRVERDAALARRVAQCS